MLRFHTCCRHVKFRFPLVMVDPRMAFIPYYFCVWVKHSEMKLKTKRNRCSPFSLHAYTHDSTVPPHSVEIFNNHVSHSLCWHGVFPRLIASHSWLHADTPPTAESHEALFSLCLGAGNCGFRPLQVTDTDRRASALALYHFS